MPYMRSQRPLNRYLIAVEHIETNTYHAFVVAQSLDRPVNFTSFRKVGSLVSCN